MDRWANVAVMFLYVALATTLVFHKNTARDISAAGGAFAGSIRAATGNASGPG